MRYESDLLEGKQSTYIRNEPCPAAMLDLHIGIVFLSLARAIARFIISYIRDRALRGGKGRGGGGVLPSWRGLGL